MWTEAAVGNYVLDDPSSVAPAAPRRKNWARMATAGVRVLAQGTILLSIGRVVISLPICCF